jgi:hypothetical protein
MHGWMQSKGSGKSVNHESSGTMQQLPVFYNNYNPVAISCHDSFNHFFIIKGPKLILDSVLLSICIQCLIHMGEGNSGKAAGEGSSGIAQQWLDWCN